MNNKKVKLKKKYKFLIIATLFITIILLWSRYISTSGLIVNEHKVINNNLPTSFHGFKIVHFSDIHYGRTINKKRLNQLVDQINYIKPDIVVFTGDLLDKDAVINDVQKKELIQAFSNIEALFGKYAISGNHDLLFDEYNEILEESQFINLNNSFDIIFNKNYDAILIAGLESEINGNPDINALTYLWEEKQIDENKDIEPSFKIMIMHTPDTFSKIRKYNFDLVLAGHSHNGQIRLPLIGAVKKPVGAKQYYKPYYKIDSTDFFISNGLGTSVINFRFFNKPSFNFYRITNY